MTEYVDDETKRQRRLQVLLFLKSLLHCDPLAIQATAPDDASVTDYAMAAILALMCSGDADTLLDRAIAVTLVNDKFDV